MFSAVESSAIPPPWSSICILTTCSLYFAQRSSYSACFWSISACLSVICCSFSTICALISSIWSFSALIWPLMVFFSCTSNCFCCSASALSLATSFSCWRIWSSSDCSSFFLFSSSFCLSSAWAGIAAFRHSAAATTAAISAAPARRTLRRMAMDIFNFPPLVGCG